MNHLSSTVGIDLGTSNAALVFASAQSAAMTVLAIPQLSSPGRVITQPTLPTVTYLPHEGEVSASDTRLPWQIEGETEQAFGLWARERGALVADRMISSAKSWLCHEQVDRQSAILPWGSQVARKLSPVDALASYLSYLKSAFAFERRKEGGSESLADCELVLTVPASFDEVARSLIQEAAERAELGRFTLLEEPQAAFYGWIAHHEKTWRHEVSPGDLVLVVDVGGGTTDFSLIAVTGKDGDLGLERVSVGDHLLLGGDNMDLSLAYAVKAKLEAQGAKLDRWQLLSLVGAVRTVKETLLAPESEHAECPIAIAGKGSSLFAQTLTTTLSRDEVCAVLLDGFFPMSELGDHPRPRLGSGLQEFGLPYAHDPAISRHLARFLKRSRDNINSNAKLRDLVEANLEATGCLDQDCVLPNLVLFNGGVFNAVSFRERVLAVLNSWSSKGDVRELVSPQLDLAVAYGAAYFARAKARGEGIRIAAGTARSYYLGLESAALAVPGLAPELKGLCVVPQGTEEGSHLALPQRPFGLMTGEPTRFRFFSSAVRAGDQVGCLLDDAVAELDETAILEVTLPLREGSEVSEMVPVYLDASINELGTLEIYMKHLHSPQKWKVEFNVRPQFSS